jgi:hypothetical protein
MRISATWLAGRILCNEWLIVGHTQFLGWRPDQREKPVGSVPIRRNTL